jgi:hypothetical protein
VHLEARPLKADIDRQKSKAEKEKDAENAAVGEGENV